MTGRTNYTEVANSGPMQGPAQITGVFEHFDPLLGETKPTAANLPLSGNWIGRTILVEDSGISRVWLGSGWGYGDGDTGWITLTPATGWTAYLPSVWGTPAYRFRSGKVSVQGVLLAGSGYTSKLFNIPLDFRPPNNKQFAAWIGTNSGNIVIQSGGDAIATGSFSSGSTVSLGELQYSRD